MPSVSVSAMKLLRRILIFLVGGTVLLIGILMILLPAPSTLVILVGLAILAIEFAWARHWLAKVRQCLPGKKRAAVGIAPLPDESGK
jgi:tellurite resistance protein TerC